jgi:23S rRNA (adenine2503-C2)-methyltransferase
MTDRSSILGKNIEELREIVQSGGFPPYSATQIADWLYKKSVRSFDQMSNLSKAARDFLESNYDTGFSNPVKVQVSDDGTKKYLFRVRADKYIESVYIPETARSTLCISSQIGCKMGCVFCMTGKQGFSGDLAPFEILNQILSLPEKEKLTNYVFMGMGEPLANTENLLKSLEIMTSSPGLGISPSRITVSTIGILPGLEQLLNKSRCHIAVSLHSPFDTERQELVPLEKVFPVSRVVEYLKQNMHNRQQRVSFEYIMFRGINDSPRHINGITRLLNGMRCRINLIRYHPVPGVAFEPSDEQTINWFKTRLNEKGILTTVRASRGRDISAACGMLSTLNTLQKSEDF